MAGSLPGAATSLKTLFLVKQDKGKCTTFSVGQTVNDRFLKTKMMGKCFIYQLFSYFQIVKLL